MLLVLEKFWGHVPQLKNEVEQLRRDQQDPDSVASSQSSNTEYVANETNMCEISNRKIEDSWQLSAAREEQHATAAYVAVVGADKTHSAVLLGSVKMQSHSLSGHLFYRVKFSVAKIVLK